MSARKHVYLPLPFTTHFKINLDNCSILVTIPYFYQDTTLFCLNFTDTTLPRSLIFETLLDILLATNNLMLSAAAQNYLPTSEHNFIPLHTTMREHTIFILFEPEQLKYMRCISSLLCVFLISMNLL